MAGNEIDLRGGRQVSAPETPLPQVAGSGRRESKATAGPIPVRLVSPSLDVTVAVNPTAPAAYAVIDGDKKDEVRVAWESGMWTLTWPEDAGVTTIHGGGIVFGNGNVQVTSFGRGRTVINGTGMPGKDQPKVHLILPSGCSLYCEVSAGEITIPPAADERHGLSVVSLTSQSGGLDAGCAIGQVLVSSQSGGVSVTGYTGNVNVNTMSGGIDLEHAAGDVQAKTMSGNVSVHCERDVTVMASSMSGSVRVSAADGVTVRGSGSSMSGSVRVPATMSGGGRHHGW